MLNCPFCGFDYTDEGLREGRCPSCGGVLAWDESVQTMAGGDFVEPAPDIDDRPAPAPIAAPPASPGNAGMPLDAGDEPHPTYSAAEPISGETPKSDTTPDSVDEEPPGNGTHPDIPPTVVPRNLNDGQQRHMTAMWAGALAGSTTPGMTIKTSAALAEVASHLVVRPRTLVRRGDGHVGPADYELLEAIGQGGVGVVYSARQASIDRTVAVKMLKPGMDGVVDREKFLSEAVVTGDLDHPNIVPIHDLGSDKHGALFYSMKQVQGTPWSQVIREKSQAENFEILMKVCDAIAFAHARGVIHRDIKPENVMLGDFGEVLVMDWGIALSMSLIAKTGAESNASSMGGTPTYMAPEMATGPMDAIGRTSDVYLLGAVLFEIITGLPPHTGVDVRSCLMAAARNEIRPTEKSGELLDITYRALSTKPEDRYGSVQDLQDAIREYQSHSESISLANRADEGLKEAEHSKDYQDYSHALFAFEEALSLWEHNDKAHEGVERAKVAYATAAHAKGDYDLGLSLLDDETSAFTALRRKLQAAVRERDTRVRRLRNMKRIAGTLLVAILGGGSILFAAIVMLYQDADRQRETAEYNASQANIARKQAVQMQGEAVTAQKLAAKQRDIALQERERAENEKQNALRSIRREAESSYKSEILLAVENIDSNDFSGARNILLEHRDSPKRKLRHWEWGRLLHRCQLDQLTLDAGQHESSSRSGPVETVAFSPDDSRVAVGTSDGWVYIWGKSLDSHWDRAASRLICARDVGSPVYALAFSHSGSWLATAGGTDRQGVVNVWTIEPVASNEEGGQSGRSAVRLAPHEGVSVQCGHSRRVTCVSFSNDDRQLLTGSEDRTVRLTTWQSDDQSLEFRGHFDTVWSAEFSNDDAQTWIVTASEDGTVRIWDRDTRVTVRPLQEHEGPVYSAVFSPDDRYVASGGYDRRVLVCPTNLVELELERERGKDLGALARTMFVSKVRARLDGEDPVKQSVHDFAGHRSSVRTVRFSPSGSLLISGSRDNTLNVWDTGLDSGADVVESSADAAVSDERTLLKHLRERREDQSQSSDESLLLTLRGHAGGVYSSALSADGLTVLSGSHDMTAKVWSLADYRELDVFRSGKRSVLSAAISPDRHYLAAGYEDGTATVWDLREGTTTQIPARKDEPVLVEGHDYLASNAAFSRGGSLLFTAAGDHSVRIWDVDQGTQVARVPEPTGHHGVLAVSPDGAWLVTGSDQKSAFLWKIDDQGRPTDDQGLLDHTRTLRERLALQYPNGDKDELEKRVPDVTAACISPQGNLAVIGDADGGCWVWELPSRILRHELTGQRRRINAVKFAPDGQTVLAASADHTVAAWDVKTGREARGRLPHDGSVTGLDVIAIDGETYVLTASAAPGNAGSESNEQTKADGRTNREFSLRRWRLGTGELTESVAIAAERINSVAFAPNGGSALVSASGNQLFSWDFGSDPPASPDVVWNDTTRRGAISGAIFSPARDQILTFGGDGAGLWDRASGEKLHTYSPHDTIRAVSFSADGEYLITASDDGSAKIWSYRAGEVRALSKLEGGTTGEHVAHGHVGPVNSAVFHPHPGTMTILTASSDGTAKRWERSIDNTWRVTHTYDVGAPVTQAAFSPDGASILTTSVDGVVRIWDVESTQQPLRQLRGHVEGQAVLCGCFSPDGRWVLSGGEDRSIVFFDVLNGTELVRMTGFPASVSTVAFSPDRHRVLIGVDKSVRVLDVKQLCASTARGVEALPSDLKEIITLEAHQRDVTSATFSLDGRDVITSSWDGKTILWKGDLVEASIELSLDFIDYTKQGEVIAVDPYALVRDPSTVDFEGGFLEILLEIAGTGNEEQDNLAAEQLDVGSGASGDVTETAQVGDKRITVDKNGEIRFEGQHIATRRSADEDKASLTFDLTGQAHGLSIEALLHSITYRNDALGDTDRERTVSVVLRDGKGREGNYEQSTEVKTIRVPAPRTTEASAAPAE